MNSNKEVKIGDSVELIKTDRCSHTGFKTLKGTKGTVVNIPSYREDVVDVDFGERYTSGAIKHRVIFISDLKKL